MAKIILTLVIFTGITVIYIIGKMAKLSKERWELAKQITSDDFALTSRPKLEQNFDLQHSILDNFLFIQELPVLRNNKLSFNCGLEKIRYLYFVLGAINALSNTIRDTNSNELYWHTTSIARATILYGVDDAIEIMSEYGTQTNQALLEASKRGYYAMQDFINHISDKSSSETATRSSMEMYKVVRNINS